MDQAVETFIEQARAGGATRVIVAWQDEWDVTAERGFGPVRRARLLAYAGGEVIAGEVPGEVVDRDALLARLRQAGLGVDLRSRNRG